MSKKCSNCGYDMPDDAVFCTECGTKMEASQSNTDTQKTQNNTTENNSNPQQNAEQKAQQNAQQNAQQDAQQNHNTQQGYGQNYQYNDQPNQQSQNPNYQYNQNTSQSQGNNGAPYTQYSTPQYNQAVYNVIPNNSSENKVVSTGAFFGLNLLFSLPGIGWIICIIMAFAPQNKNIKNYARSKLIWLVIGIVLGVILFLIMFNIYNQYGYDLNNFSYGYGQRM